MRRILLDVPLVGALAVAALIAGPADAAIRALAPVNQAVNRVLSVHRGRRRATTSESWRPARTGSSAPSLAINSPRVVSAALSPAAPPASTAFDGVSTIGALFDRDGAGDHFCTASVISSSRGNLLITAAHCIHAGRGGGYRTNLAFVPGYHDGIRPYGTWNVTAAFVDPRWAATSDPDLDVGFLTVAPQNGRQIADVVGANRFVANQGFTNSVTVIGYPGDQQRPITCTNDTVMQSHSQIRFDCAGYTDGTSGGPWLTNYDFQTGVGDVMGVIGGYEQGGSSPDVSYTAYFDAEVQHLYEQVR